MNVLSEAQGWLLIGVFFIAMFSVLAFLPKARKTKKFFLVGNRNVPWVMTPVNLFQRCLCFTPITMKSCKGGVPI